MVAMGKERQMSFALLQRTDADARLASVWSCPLLKVALCAFVKLNRFAPHLVAQ